MDWLHTLSEAENKPYKLGEHDCLRVACAVVHSRTGVDHWPKFAGYKTKRQAISVIKNIAPTLREAVTVTLGTPDIVPTLAQRGDIVLYHDAEDHLGVCTGDKVAILGPDGLLYVSITSPMLKAAWRVKCQQP